MSSLPLFRGAPISETGDMSSTPTSSSGRRSWLQLLRSVSLTIAGVVAECNRANRTMMRLSAAPDRYLPDSAQAPDDYAEFLFRTSGPLAHEASARQRLAAARSPR
jgi:hypothetical protein